MYHGIVHLLFFNFYISSFLFTASTPEETTPSQTVKTTSPPQTVGTTSPPQTVGMTSPPQTVGTIITSGTVPVSSNIQLTNNLPSNGTTTTTVITVVAVVIILVFIVVGVVILVVLFRAKKKQKLEINNLQNVTMGSELKQKDTTVKGASSIPAQPLYAVMQKEVPLAVPSKSDNIEYLNQTCSLSEYKLVAANSEYAVNAKFPRVVNLSQSMLEELESNPMYQSMDQHRGSPSTANVCHKEMTSTLCQTPPAHIHLRHKMECMRQCIVSQSTLQSPRMQLEIPVILPFTEILGTPLGAAIKQHFEEHRQLVNSIHIDLIPHVGYHYFLNNLYQCRCCCNFLVG